MILHLIYINEVKNHSYLLSILLFFLHEYLLIIFLLSYLLLSYWHVEVVYILPEYVLKTFFHGLFCFNFLMYSFIHVENLIFLVNTFWNVLTGFEMFLF